jgi:hypothetical protein
VNPATGFGGGAAREAPLHVVFLAWRSGHGRRTHDYLRALKVAYRPATLLVVENAGDLQPWRGSGLWAVPGDNRWREFSGWDFGVRTLEQGPGLADDHRLLFINDTVCRKDYLVWLTLNRARRLLAHDAGLPRPAAVCGPMEPSRFGTVRAFGGALSSYVATFFFVLSAADHRRLGGLAGDAAALDGWLGRHWPEPLFQVPGEPAYNTFFNAWLGCTAPGGVGTWPGSAACPFGESNYAALRAKAGTILLETRLSARLAREHGPGWARDLYHPKPWRRLLEAAFARRARWRGLRAGQ